MSKLFKQMTTKEIIMIGFSVLLIALSVWLELEVPTYMSNITKLLSTSGTKIDQIMEPGAKMIALSLTSFLVTVAVGFIAARVAASFITRLRSQIFQQVMTYSQKEIKTFSIPSLLTRTTNDLTNIQVLITMGLQVVTRGPIMAFWAIGKIMDKSQEWLMITAAAVAAMILMLAVLLIFAFPKIRVVQKLTDRLNSVTREILSGIRVVRAYNGEAYQDEKFFQANQEVTKTNLFVGRLMAIMNPSLSLIASSLTLMVYWIGAGLINEAALADKVNLFSDMVIFSSYAMQVVMSFMLMVAVFFILPRALVSAGRIAQVLSLASSVPYVEKSRAEQARKAQPQLVFDNVSFRYSPTAEAVVQDVSFTAEAGQTIAFIGSTGSGKSSLVNLLPRFYDVTQGAIFLDGLNIKDYSQADLAEKIGYIPQKPVLFSGTIRSNMTLGSQSTKSLTEEDIWQALDLAQAKSFVEDKEMGLETEVAQGGTNFSGGQRQRLAIARALARKPDILIFDDSFSALDYKTDRILRSALAKETKDMTKLIVAQRISTIMDADLILVLDQGKVVGQGRHQELLANNSVYQEIAYSQLSKEELVDAK
ncbi:ABC transporter ATP-binding protein [Streptococcus cuniculipharyngis]|uniref:ABC transporter ATP-binding protein n=1 Tax=Streptococcus cuniculipharyngis TaxID=1562651 RepID=A0A5C5SA08_9STRE|nr:ABC transporter ATP-binding protein [Streptococcus cuniculipharyngis]TWS96943.1 ABC transporter ATP-binding protein [Streptococcus cuniculipharyngis]